MALNKDELKLLKEPFSPSEHEFTRGMCYIREWAICDRIEEVDASWDFSVVSIEHRNNQVIVLGRMTIAGVTRENTGMETIGYTKDKGDNRDKTDTKKVATDLTGAPVESNEAEKSATTDALKRCARLFGVGRYLLMLDDTVKDERTLKAWLDRQNNKVTTIDEISNTWSEAVARAYVKHWQDQGLTTADMLMALNVTKLGDWKADRKAADERTKRWIDTKQGDAS